MTQLVRFAPPGSSPAVVVLQAGAEHHFTLLSGAFLVSFASVQGRLQHVWTYFEPLAGATTPDPNYVTTAVIDVGAGQSSFATDYVVRYTELSDRIVPRQGH
jgi:hypothetical protein